MSRAVAPVPFEPATFVSPIRAVRATRHPQAVDLSLGEPLGCWPEGLAARLGSGLIDPEARGMPYLPHAGDPDLIEIVTRRTGVGRALITGGAQAALAAALMARIRPGDGVVVPDPGFLGYPPLIRWAGGRPVAISADPCCGGLDLEALEAALARGARGLVLGQPANPTGAALDAERMVQVQKVLADHGAWLVADLVYAELPQGVEAIARPDPALCETAFVSSTAKAWAAPALRVGWLASDAAEWVDRATRVHALFATHASALAQRAALGLLQCLDPADVAARLAVRGRLALEALREVLPELTLPAGGFYLWVPVPDDDVVFCRELGERPDGVAVVPGSVFGEAGRGFVRVSYGASEAAVAVGARRLAAALMAPLDGALS